MANNVSFSQLSREVVVIIILAAIAAFLIGLSVGRRIGPVYQPGVVEPAPPVSDIDGREPGNVGGGDGGVACTMEAKACPDGSYVGRTGPNCEFTPCPGEVQ